MAYTYDLHVHSCMSHDCKTSLKSLVSIVKRRGLNGIALTDHDTMEGVAKLQKIWPHEELQLIAGCERTLDDGSHIIGLFIERPPVSNLLREVITEIQEQGGIVYLPHPFRNYAGLLRATSGYDSNDQAWALEQTNIIEVYNHKCTPDENRKALELLDRYPKAFSAASDAHFAFQIGWGCTVYDQPLSVKVFSPITCYALVGAMDVQNVESADEPQKPSIQSIIKKILRAIGLFEPARAFRNYIRCFRKPNLQRYR